MSFLGTQLPLFTTAQLRLTPFWRWFGDSKVVDADGRPLVVYHGTDRPLRELHLPDNPRHGGAHGAGFYFTPRRAYAESFAYGAEPTILEAYVSLQHPLVLRTHGPDFPRWYPDPAESPASIRARIERAGYDGVMIYDGRTGSLLEVVAFHPGQVKSVDARRWNPKSSVLLDGWRRR